MTIGKIDVSKTIDNVESFLRNDKKLSPEVRAMFELLVTVIKLLTDKLGLNSRNSSKPPSSDPNRKRKKVTGSKRKSGGQNGHKGNYLQKVKNPDRIETLDLDKKKLPPGQYKHAGYESRQVIDIEISTVVTEYRAEILKDQNGNEYVADFPEGVNRPVQYGNALKAKSVYMSQQQLLPYERLQDYCNDQCGLSISQGTLVNFNTEAFDRLEYFEVLAKKRLIAAGVVNADETGININGERLWLHSASNDLWTLFYPHKNRGVEAMEEMGILKFFKGILCHDHWKPYFSFKCLHALCNAHHLRELERAYEQDGQKWAKKMKRFLLKLKETVEKADGALTDKTAKKYVKRYRAILTKGMSECPVADDSAKPKRGRSKRSKARNLLERLINFEGETLRFMTHKQVPFTNNQSENDIRMTKVQQKISGCFRSIEGAKIFCRVRSYLSTCRKHGIKPTKALRILFSNKPPKFLDQLE